MKAAIVMIFWLQIAVSKSKKEFFSFSGGVSRGLTLRIIGGETVSSVNAYPFQAALFVYSNRGAISLCGGSLISPQWILTAAHCLPSDTQNVVVRLGTNNIAVELSTQQTFHSGSYFIHPNYHAFTNDVALVKLPRNATLNNYVSVIALSPANLTYAGLNGTVLGWGKTETGNISNILMKVVVGIMSNAACKAAHPSYELITNIHLCTSGYGIKGSCNGDSGGPLIVNNVQVGIVSFGPENCTLGYPSVFTRISEFKNWVEYTMQNSSCICLIPNIFMLCIIGILIV